MTNIAERIEQVCVLLDEGELRDLAEEAGAGRVLERILAGGSPDEELRQDLDTLDGALARLGVGMVTQPDRAYRPLSGLGAGHPVVHAWACPGHRACSRVETVDDDAPPPHCAVHDRPLELVRVPT